MSPCFAKSTCRVTCCSLGMQVSKRVLVTDPPIIVKTKQMIARAPPSKQVLSLAQGIVHWQPPPAATQLAGQLLNVGAPSIHGYGPADGLPRLTEALQHKLSTKNNLQGYQVMVTAGANQAFVNLVLTLCDTSDKVVLFAPYYFNHLMALQMTGGGDQVALGPCHPDTLQPDLEWLQQQLQGPHPPRMVVIVNPCNPTGVLLPSEELQRAADMCAEARCWLVLDNTYEDFVYDGRQHHAISAPNVIHVFSFSKAYGMMGWRVGYIAYPSEQLLEDSQQLAGHQLASELMKVQDTIPICPSQLSQHIALAALEHGSSYIQQQIAGLCHNRAVIADALTPLGTNGHGWVGGEGAIYFFAKLPDRFRGGSFSSSGAGLRGSNGNSSINDSSSSSSSSTGCYSLGKPIDGDSKFLPLAAAGDEAVVEWLIQEHGVCVIPGSSCGAPGYVRVAFANLKPAQCEVAAARLKGGLQQLISMDCITLAA